MKDIIFDNFQDSVDNCLIRHRSILDVLTKYTESSSRINRCIAKAVTNCGCIQISASKQKPLEENYSDEHDIKKHLDPHITGKLCGNCREVIEKEIGTNLFYLTSLCNQLDINLYDVLLKEYNKNQTLGRFNLR